MLTMIPASDRSKLRRARAGALFEEETKRFEGRVGTRCGSLEDCKVGAVIVSGGETTSGCGFEGEKLAVTWKDEEEGCEGGSRAGGIGLIGGCALLCYRTM